MDWALFNKYCNNPQFFEAYLDANNNGLVSQKKARFIIQIFVEVARALSETKAVAVLPLRQWLWKTHFGVPHLDFLLTHQQLIVDVAERVSYAPDTDLSSIFSESFTQIASQHDNYAAYHCPEFDVSSPFVATKNNQGFMTTHAKDIFSKQFVDTAKASAATDGKVLEIGAAYGVATLAALGHGATVFCNDLEPYHLAVAAKEHMKLAKGRLVLVPGAFPSELVFESNFFDAILISRVLHFFSGEAIVQALAEARAWLKPGGSLFVVNETPFLANWEPFWSEYEARKERGDRWPGLIDNPRQYEKGTAFVSKLPALLHFFDHETLEQALSEAGFNKENMQIEYINRAGQFPIELLVPQKQKESIGCRVTK